MSLLPQRKKSPEEIARLRESLGIPQTQDDPAGEAPEQLIPTTHQAQEIHPEPAVHIDPPASSPDPFLHRAFHSHQPVHTDSHDEPVPVLKEAPPVHPTLQPEPVTPKRAKSLKKSEQAPIPPPNPIASPEQSLAAFHRHSDAELAELRRRDALARLAAPPPPNLTHAHPAVTTLGYLGPAAAAAGIWFYQVEMRITASCLAVSLLIAILISFRNPYSRHHAAFIIIAVLFTAAFGALHYFPQLTFQHGP